MSLLTKQISEAFKTHFSFAFFGLSAMLSVVHSWTILLIPGYIALKSASGLYRVYKKTVNTGGNLDLYISVYLSSLIASVFYFVLNIRWELYAEAKCLLDAELWTLFEGFVFFIFYLMLTLAERSNIK